jgi:hypothetical protein
MLSQLIKIHKGININVKPINNKFIISKPTT